MLCLSGAFYVRLAAIAMVIVFVGILCLCCRGILVKIFVDDVSVVSAEVQKGEVKFTFLSTYESKTIMNHYMSGIFAQSVRNEYLVLSLNQWLYRKRRIRYFILANF